MSRSQTKLDNLINEESYRSEKEDLLVCMSKIDKVWESEEPIQTKQNQIADILVEHGLCDESEFTEDETNQWANKLR